MSADLQCLPPQMVEEEDASAEAEEVRQERMGLTPDWLIDVRLHNALLSVNIAVLKLH